MGYILFILFVFSLHCLVNTLYIYKMKKTKNNPKEEIQEINPANLATVSNLASEWEVSMSTVYGWIKLGQIKKVQYLGKPFLDKSTFNPQISKAMLEVIVANYSKKTA